MIFFSQNLSFHQYFGKEEMDLQQTLKCGDILQLTLIKLQTNMHPSDGFIRQHSNSWTLHTIILGSFFRFAVLVWLINYYVLFYSFKLV